VGNYSGKSRKGKRGESLGKKSRGKKRGKGKTFNRTPLLGKEEVASKDKGKKIPLALGKRSERTA